MGVKITTKTITTRELELDHSMVEILIRDWAYDTQGFHPGAVVDLMMHNDRVGAIITETHTHTEGS